jgi:hypothetical protein
MSDTPIHALIEPFIQQILARGEVWVLGDDEGCAQCDSSLEDGSTVLLFWHSASAARACATDDWADFDPQKIELEEFLEDWLPGMIEDGVSVGLDWTPDLEGEEIDPELVLEALELAWDKS